MGVQEPGLVPQPWEISGELGLQLRGGPRDAGWLGVLWLVLQVPLKPELSLAASVASFPLVLPSWSTSHLDSELSAAWVLGAPPGRPKDCHWTLGQGGKRKRRPLLPYPSANPPDSPLLRLLTEDPEGQVVVADPSVGAWPHLRIAPSRSPGLAEAASGLRPPQPEEPGGTRMWRRWVEKTDRGTETGTGVGERCSYSFWRPC